jgi:hypothetical protein
MQSLSGDAKQVSYCFAQATIIDITGFIDVQPACLRLRLPLCTCVPGTMHTPASSDCRGITCYLNGYYENQ